MTSIDAPGQPGGGGADAGAGSGVGTGESHAIHRGRGTGHHDAAPNPFAIGTLAAVLVGGALGTAARVGFGALAELVDPAAAFYADNPVDHLSAFADPALLAILAANVLGSLLLGVVTGATWPARLDWLRAGCGAGFCGAFTTFSFVMLAFAVLGFSSGVAWGLHAIGVVLDLIYAAVGMMIGRVIAPRRDDTAGGHDTHGTHGTSVGPGTSGPVASGTDANA
ncbi:MAG: fluoride efflux transporter FluC [Pseudoclavibacter sp.]